VLQLAAVGARSALELVAFLRRSPVLTRNIDLRGLDLPPALPRVVTGRGAVVTGLTDVPLVLGAALAVTWGSGTVAVVGAVTSLVLAAAVVATIGTALLRLQRRNPRRLVPARVDEALEALAPEVVLYFSGRPSTLYQLQMWLEVAERLPRRVLVVLRDRDSLLALDPTTLPVLCIPLAPPLAALELPTAKVVLLTANAAENIHMLRRRGLTSVFVGHGDSDKPYSASPFVKVYDEVWVAGQAGRERFAEAEVHLAPEAVVEVGRPQLSLLPVRHRNDPTFTVLYAPTWEGWGDVEFHTSVPHVGEALVRALLARPGVRVLYRPHPLTGTRDDATRAAHRRITALLTAAGAVRTSTSPQAPTAGGVAAASGERRRRTEDYLEHSVRHSVPDLDRAAHVHAEVARERGYWDAVPPGTHHVVDDGWPALQSCFAEADLLVADVSSVVSDWLVTGKPYAVLNPSPDPAETFEEKYPSARGGRVVGPDLAGLGPLLDALVVGEDPDRTARAAERDRLVGEVPEASLTRFAAAVDRLCTRSDSSAARPAGQRAGLPVPTQKDA
ncbi:MAG: glycerophosphotransferase, partial [Actinobacteria bacterium]|nr:glycerophosphotransferase [Actinomycetota bacterium]